MTSQDPFFSSLIEKGQFRIDDKGHAILFGEYLFLIPPHVILHMQEELEEELGSEKMKNFMSDMGSFQVENGLRRYRENYGWDEIPRDKLSNYIEKIARIVGWGQIDFKSIDSDEGSFRIEVSSPTFPAIYLDWKDERADEPICHYLRGMMGEAMSAIIDGDLEVEETECAAVEGKMCVIEGEARG